MPGANTQQDEKKISGRIIREQRERLGLSPQDLANAIGVKEYLIPRFENNQSTPASTTMLRLNELFFPKG